jgi:pantoate--beta-alanine ligase
VTDPSSLGADPPQVAAAPPVDRTVADLRVRVAGWRREGRSVALVPTMGSLHAGHTELVKAAGADGARVVVSIFVNPTQFAPTEDLSAYPRNEARDLEGLAGMADSVFAPAVEEMYPSGFATTVSLAGPAIGLESDFRPNHFAGVATVVTKLLLSALPDRAWFGEKDYQQLLVVRRMARDLAIPVDIEGLPTVREADGLALSSRNVYLSPEERETAPELYNALTAAAEAIRGGALAMTALAEARQYLASHGFDVDYVELRDAATLSPVTDQAAEPLRILAAARLGRTRLIDNVAV